MSNQTIQQDNQLLDIEAVSKLTTLGKSTIRLWVTQTKFPKPIELGINKKVWRAKDINTYINSKLPS